MISKELLNKVLNIEIVSYQMKQKNILAYEYNKVSKNQWSGKTFCNRSINIYELAHKCKEWAYYKHGYIIFSKTRISSSLASCYFDTMAKHDYEDDYCDDFRAETEYEAIFKACSWILEQIKKEK